MSYDAIQKISGVILESTKILEHTTKFQRATKKYLSWTDSDPKVYENLVQKIREQRVVEAILHITSLFEYSLGNVYWTNTRKQPPHLLRDLLETNEIWETFEKFEVNFHFKLFH